ncbi:MAG: YsnF/AvaK domain-containing protein [Acidobacteriota bacterium]|nr:YsnF/AvaK domain-containing protein [Acidobacteriota bacterium]
MATTLVGIFDDNQQAQATVQALAKLGIKQGNIQIAKNDHPNGYATYGGANSKDYTTGTSIGDKIGNFFESLFGSDVDENERGVYAESVRRGSTVVTAQVEDNMVDRASDIMNKNGAVDVDRRMAQYKASGFQKFDAKAPLYAPDQAKKEFQTFGAQGEVALPVIEEQLQVGKRAVQRGGVRVHSRVTERPVEETVTLREEQVHVERRPVNREVSQADMSAMREGTFDVTTTGEEAVVSKQARVVEEVVIGKDVTQREETVRDTVRRTDVEVEEMNTDTTKARGKGNRS